MWLGNDTLEKTLVYYSPISSLSFQPLAVSQLSLHWSMIERLRWFLFPDIPDWATELLKQSQPASQRRSLTKLVNRLRRELETWENKNLGLLTWLLHSRGMLHKRSSLIQISNAFSTVARRPLPAHTRMKPCGAVSISCGWGVPLGPLCFHSCFSLCLLFLLSAFSTCCPPSYTLTVNGVNSCRVQDGVKRRWNNSLTFHIGNRRLALCSSGWFQLQFMPKMEQTFSITPT